MLWGQQIKVYTDHKHLKQDALGSSSDRVYRWRLLPEEFASCIVYIKGINNTVADAISRLDYTPTEVPKDANIDDRSINNKAMCNSAFMQSFADKNDIDVHHLRWKTISKYFNKKLFNFSTGIESVHGIGSPLYEREERVGLSLYNCSSKEHDEMYPRQCPKLQTLSAQIEY